MSVLLVTLSKLLKPLSNLSVIYLLLANVIEWAVPEKIHTHPMEEIAMGGKWVGQHFHRRGIGGC